MKSNILMIIAVVTCCSTLVTAADSVFIVIHGTWGSDSSWYMPGGDFFDALEQTVCKKKSAVVPFCWSGGCGHESRYKAAHNLVKLIKTYDASTAIFLVAHSHGGNVCMLASQILSQETCNNYRIRAVYLLATPVMSTYLPNMDVIMYVYNLFSLEDLVQPVLGISERIYAAHARIANLRVVIDSVQPGHADMHHAVIGRWIPLMHRIFKEYLRRRNVCNTISEPSIIYFDSTKAPFFCVDEKREELLDRDHQISVLMVNSLRRSFDTESKIPLTNL